MGTRNAPNTRSPPAVRPVPFATVSDYSDMEPEGISHTGGAPLNQSDLDPAQEAGSDWRFAMTVQLSFLLSLPRSGSTLLQRLIATHPEVSTASEPWLLLPLMYAMRDEGISAEYNQKQAHRGLVDFADRLPEGFHTYELAVRDLAMRLYDQAAEPGASWFLDKTPRYYFIASDLIVLFPDAKFILLSRNPLAVAASVVTRFGGGSWVIPRWESYLKAGISHLFTPEIISQCLQISYEDLVADPNRVTARVHEYLGLETLASPAERFGDVALLGSHGDHSPEKTVHGNNPDAWTRAFSNPIRRRWAENFISWIGQERLSRMGYDQYDLLETLETAPRSVKGSFGDIRKRVIWSTRTKIGQKVWTDPLHIKAPT